MIKFRKGDKIEAPSGSIGLVLKRRGEKTYMFWLDNLHKKLDKDYFGSVLGIEEEYGWAYAHVDNETQNLIYCKKIGTYSTKEYETYKILYGDNK